MLVTLPLLKAGLPSNLMTAGQSQGWAAYTDAQLADLVLEAHAVLAGALGWEIVATHTVETQTGNGTARLFLRRYPVCAVNSIALLIPGEGASPASYNVYNPAYSIVRWDTGEIDNYSAFAIQLAGSYSWFPKGTPIAVDYVYGYPMANLAADCTQGATTLTVDNPLGFNPGQDYRIEDGVHTEVFTLQSVAGSVLTLSAGTLFAHTAASALAVTNMPREVIRVTRRLCERRILGRNSQALTGAKARMSKQGDITESFAEVLELTPADLALLSPNLTRVAGGFV